MIKATQLRILKHETAYRDSNKDFGAIEIFTAFEPLNTVLKKIKAKKGFLPLSDIAVTSFAYHFTDVMHNEHPEAKGLMSKGHAYDLKSNHLSWPSFFSCSP